MGKMELKRNRKDFELNLFESGSSSYYRNIVDRDQKKIAQILIDLSLFGLPIDKAISIYLKKMRNKDWLGL